MTRSVITLEANTTVKRAVEVMDKEEIGCLVILLAGKPVGIVTERDLLKRVLLERRDPVTTQVSSIMSSPLIFGQPEMRIQDAVDLMVTRRVKKLPIMEEGHVLGLMTLTDIARSIAYLEHVFTSHELEK